DAEDTTTHRPLTYTTYDNLDRPIQEDLYDGDGFAPVDNGAGVPVIPTAYQNRLRARRTLAFDDQDRLFRTRTFSVDQNNGQVSTAGLTAEVWYDHRGLVVKSSEPGGLVRKTHFDGAARPDRVYLTDGAGDTSWADAMTVTAQNIV